MYVCILYIKYVFILISLSLNNHEHFRNPLVLKVEGDLGEWCGKSFLSLYLLEYIHAVS